jgi:hypothetical protein
MPMARLLPGLFHCGTARLKTLPEPASQHVLLKACLMPASCLPPNPIQRLHFQLDCSPRQTM